MDESTIYLVEEFTEELLEQLEATGKSVHVVGMLGVRNAMRDETTLFDLYDNRLRVSTRLCGPISSTDGTILRCIGEVRRLQLKRNKDPGPKPSKRRRKLPRSKKDSDSDEEDDEKDILVETLCFVPRIVRELALFDFFQWEACIKRRRKHLAQLSKPQQT